MDSKIMTDVINARDVQRRALEHYGAAHQLVKTVEELGELQQAIAKLWNGTDGDMDALADHVLEEAADVVIMLGQIRLMFTDGAARMDEWKKAKIERLARRLEEAGGDG